MKRDQKIPPLDDRSFWHFFEERRWCREFRHENSWSACESKFRTGEAAVTIETLRREWPTWPDEERSDFMRSFYTVDVKHSVDVFRYFVSLAVPQDRYRYMGIFHFTLDPQEAFGVLSEWILAPDTKSRRLLFQPLVSMADKFGRKEVVAILQEVLHGILEDGNFWKKTNEGAVSPERAWEMSECLAALGWLGEEKLVLPLLERLAGAGVESSRRAGELIESGRSGQWSLT